MTRPVLRLVPAPPPDPPTPDGSLLAWMRALAQAEHECPGTAALVTHVIDLMREERTA